MDGATAAVLSCACRILLKNQVLGDVAGDVERQGSVAQQGTSQPSVLLLSGRPAFLDPLSQAFSAAGLVVLVARDAAAAVVAFQGRAGIPAGVIIDLLTIDDGADDLTTALREEPAAASVPVLFIGTGAESIRSTTDALIAGGDGFFQLPVEAGRVVAKIAAYVGTPSPILPHGLLVTIDEHDLLERTPEPVRIVVPPAMLPGDLLGDDDEFLRPSILHRGLHEHDADDALDEETPPSGIGRRPSLSGERNDDDDGVQAAPSEQFSDDFSDTTSPMMLKRRVGPRAVDLPADVVATAEGSSIPEQIDDSQDRAPISQAAEAEALRVIAFATAEVTNSVEGLHADRVIAEAALQQLDESHRRRRADAEALLAEVQERRHSAAVEIQMLRDEQRMRREAEEAELIALDAARAAVEADLLTATLFSRTRLQDEERRLQEVLAARAVAEAAMQALVAEHAARVAQEEAQVAALAAERLAAEDALVALHEEQQQRVQLEQERLKYFEARRLELESEGVAVVAAAEERLRQDHAELEILAGRHSQLQQQLDNADVVRRARLEQEAAELAALSVSRAAAQDSEAHSVAAREQRRHQEEEHLAALEAQRQSLQAELAVAAEIAAARAADEEARVAALVAQREHAAAAIARALAETQARLGDEGQRLQALQQERLAAERAVEAAHAGQARRLADEEARLATLHSEVLARQNEIARLDDHERAHRDAEQQALARLAQQRAQLEAQIAALTSSTSEEEQRTRARLAELEIARLRAHEEVEQLAEEHLRREQEAAGALARLHEEQREAEREREAHSARIAVAVAEEEARLVELERERATRQQALRAVHVAQQLELRAQQDQLQALAEQAQRERSRLADETKSVEALLSDQTKTVRRRLEAMQQEQQALVDAASREAEHLAHLRAEEEATRAALADARARARQAFVSGRFDAVPSGTSPLVFDVGSTPRAEGEGEGIPHGGPLVDVGALSHEAPPALAFVGLEPPQGRFDDGELPALLLAAWSQRVTGAVTIVGDDDRQRVVFFEEGEPVFVASSLAADRPEEALLKAGLITASVHSELRVGEAISGRRLCARLVDDGVLKLDELFSAVRGVLTEQLLHLIEGAAGTFSFSQERAHAVDRVRLEHRFDAVIAEGVRRKYDEPRLWSVLGGPATLLGVGDAAALLPPLSAEERLVIERLDGTRSLDDVVLGCGLHAHVVLRAALLAVACGAVNVLARGLPKGPDDVVARRDRSVAIDKARVIDRLALARHGDYFTFLGVEPAATPFEVHRAAAKLRERFDPARYADGAYAELRPSLREIVDVINDAEAVLADAGLREAYRVNLRAPAAAPSSSARSRTA